MSYGKSGPKSGPPTGRKPMSAALALRLTDDEVVASVASTVRRVYRGNLKLIARDADVRVDTAKNWSEGRNAPQLAAFFRLARNCPELRAEAMRLMDPEAEFNADFMRDVMAMFNTWQRMRSGQ